MKLRRRKSKAPRIEMMPIIDIVFLLLVFFIYAMLSMAVHRGLNLDLPESSTATKSAEKNTRSIFVRLLKGNIQILLDEEVVLLRELGKRLSLSETTKKPEILLFAEDSVSYQQLYRILDALKQAGCTTISLQASTE